MAAGIVFNPEEFAPDRTELSLGELGLELKQEGADWGESQVEAQLARQNIGATVTDRHLEPVEMTIPLMAREEGDVSLAEAVHKLEQTIGLYQREGGGWIRRDFDDSEGFAGSVAYQVLKASLGGVQGWTMPHRQWASDVAVKVLRSPLCYITVEAESEVFESESGVRELIFSLASVLGTAPGLIRVRITNSGSEDWRGLILAGESRDMAQDESADTTAYPVYECEHLTFKGGTTEATASGASNGKVAENAVLTAGWLSILDSEIVHESLGHMTHLGVRRLWLRTYQSGGEPGDVQLRLRWRALGSLAWSENSIVSCPAADDFYLLDLGECRPEAAALGDQRWEWELQARALSGAGTIRLDEVYPLPTEQFCVVKAPGTTQVAELHSAKAPGTVENSTEGLSEEEEKAAVPWEAPNNAKVSDNAYATVTAGDNETKQSQYLLVKKLGFAIPEGATIVGILPSVEQKASANNGSHHVVDLAARIVKGGVIGAVDKSSTGFWPTSDGIQTYGSATELWDLPWTAADINAEGFGFTLRVIVSSKALFAGCTASIDAITVTVYYTEAADENRVCFAERSIELRSDGIYRQQPTDDIWGPLIPEGFLPYASPSGLEGRKSRFIIVPSSGDLGELPDAGTNELSGQAFVRAAHLFAREAA